MKHLYLAVMEQLKEKLPEIKWIDLDQGQLDTYTERPTVPFPCILVEIAFPKCDDLYDNVQQCVASVTIRIAQNILVTRTSSETDASVRNASLMRYDLIDKSYASLQGFETDDFNPLTRKKQFKEKRSDGLFIYRIEFQTEFKDLTAAE